MRLISRHWRRYFCVTVSVSVVFILFTQFYMAVQGQPVMIDNLKHYIYKRNLPIAINNSGHNISEEDQPNVTDNPKNYQPTAIDKEKQPVAVKTHEQKEQPDSIGNPGHYVSKQEQPIEKDKEQQPAIKNHLQATVQREKPTSTDNHGQLVTKQEQHAIIVTTDVPKWLKNKKTGCNGYFTGYGNEFVWLRHARVNKTKRTFSIPCEESVPSYNFHYSGYEGTLLKGWLKDMQGYPLTEISNRNVKSNLTIVVMRIEAHNLYHTLCEWYNVFLLSKLFNFDPRQVDILLMDDRPPGLLDETWDALFGTVTRYSDLETYTVYKELIWNIIGYESPVQSHMAPELPYVKEFHNFFIGAFGIGNPHSINCSNISVTIIFRRDYMSHPERKTLFNGLIHRKFKNEGEILNEVKAVYVGHNVRAVVLEEMGMKEQVQLFTRTDVLIGMHGAGMTHVMFLPSHAAVFELFPNYWRFLQHFKAFARWRRIKYLGWQNNDPRNEFPNFYTRIPPDVIRSHSQQLKEYICP